MNIKKYFVFLKEAILGSERDFTSEPVGKAIFLLAVPMVLEMMMESVFALVDIFFVSKLGADQVATVGITESIITLVYALGIGFATATGAVVARRIGEKNADAAAKAGMQGIILGASVSVISGFFAIIYAKDLLLLMGLAPEIVEENYVYTSILLGSNLIIMMLFIINGIFRSAGDAAIAMKVLFVANFLNVVLDPCLIFGWGPFPELGIKGAAIATAIGRGTAVLYQFYLLFGGKHRIVIRLPDWRVDLKLIWELINLSKGTIGQFLISTSSWIVIMRIASEFGSETVAGYTIAIRLVIFVFLPAWGISNAAATLVGQNLGANQAQRAAQSTWQIGIVNTVYLVSASLCFLLFPDSFIRFFTEQAGVLQSGVNALVIISYGFPFFAFGMVITQALNGAGDTRRPMYMNIISFWLIQIPLAYFLSLHTDMHERGVYYSIVIAESVLTMMAIYVFKKGKWKTISV